MTMGARVEEEKEDLIHRKEKKKKSKHVKENVENEISGEEAADGKVGDELRRNSDKKKREKKLDVDVIGGEFGREKGHVGLEGKKERKLEYREGEKGCEFDVGLEAVKEKKLKKKSRNKEENEGGSYAEGSEKVEDSEALNRKKHVVGEKSIKSLDMSEGGEELNNGAKWEPAKDKKKKRKKDKGSLSEEIPDGKGLGGCTVIKELGSNEMEVIFDDAVGVEGDVTKEKNKKRDKKGTNDESLEVKSSSEGFAKERKSITVGLDGEAIKEKRKDTKRKRDGKGNDDESHKVNSFDAVIAREKKITTVGVEGEVTMENKKDRKKKRDKKGSDGECLEVKSSDETLSEEKKSSTVGIEGDAITEKKEDKKRKRDKIGIEVQSLNVKTSDETFAKENERLINNEDLTNQNDHIEGHSKKRKKERKYETGIGDFNKPIGTEKTGLEGHLSSVSKKNCRGDEEVDQHNEQKKKVKLGKRINSKEEIADCSRNSKSNDPSKRVKFSGNVEVFPLPDGTNAQKVNKNGELVRGKWFSKEEDQMIQDAVFGYIKRHGLGDNGLYMVLHCSTQRGEVRHCWKEINEALPYRPREAVRNRAHILFERDESRTWTDDDKQIIKSFYAKHGPDWKTLAGELGKNRVHMKDTWRRIKLPKLNKGQWTQEEYQTLFELVNKDLRMKVFEERKTQHGMLRDNIAWESISTVLATRTNAQCCDKWYKQLVSPLVREGIWDHADDYRLTNALLAIDVSCEEEVDWDNLLDLEHRPGHVCRKRWKEMVRHLGEHGNKSFPDQVEVLAQRYNPDLAEAREIFDNKVPVS